MDALLLSSAEVADLAGVTWRQIDHWARRGYLSVEPRPGDGPGHHRWFSPEEAQIIRRMGRLVAAGLSPRAASRAARGLEIGPGIRVVVFGDV